MARTPRVKDRRLPGRLTFLLGALVSLATATLLPDTRDAGIEPERDRPERVSIAQLLARLSPGDRQPKGMFFSRTKGTLLWQPLGPQPILGEDWSNEADASGRVSAIAVHPSDPDTAYIAAAGGGVWKTIDGGQSWTTVGDQLSSLASGGLAIDPASPDTVLYGTGEQHYSGDSLYGDGLFRTVDGGVSWSKIGLKADVGNYIARVGISPGTLHVCSDAGYVRSIDDGATWAAFKPNFFAWCNDLVRSAQAPLILFAGFYGSGVYKSLDDGATWSQLGGGLPSSGFDRINLAIADSNADVVYASLIDPSGALAGMYKTTDGGSSWALLPATPNYVCNQGWYDNGLAVSPTNPDVAFAGGVFSYCGGGIARTTNGGSSWTYVTVGTDATQVHPDQHYFTFGVDGALWVASDGGVWKTTTGGATWVNLNQGLNITQFYTVGVHPTDPNFLVGGTQDNGSLQFDGNLAWPQVLGGDGGPVAIEWSNPSRYFTTYVEMSPVYRWLRPIFYDGDATGPWFGDRASWANGPLIVDPTLATTLLAGTHRVWQTTDSGGSWNPISSDLTNGVGHLRALAVAPTDSNIIYSGSSDGRLLATFDRGTTWLPRETGLPPDQVISDLVVSPTDPLAAFLSIDQPSGGRVFETSNGGVTWEDRSGPLAAGIRGMSLAVDFNGRRAFLGTDAGVYATSDGTNWVHEAINLPNVAVYDVQVDAVNGYLVAATHGRGIWRARLSGGNSLTPGPLRPESRGPGSLGPGSRTPGRLAPAPRPRPRRGPSRLPAPPIP
jgi:photosystem II stability/assembly factor-like uncharacterized protein